MILARAGCQQPLHCDPSFFFLFSFFWPHIIPFFCRSFSRRLFFSEPEPLTASPPKGKHTHGDTPPRGCLSYCPAGAARPKRLSLGRAQRPLCLKRDWRMAANLCVTDGIARGLQLTTSHGGRRSRPGEANNRNEQGSIDCRSLRAFCSFWYSRDVPQDGTSIQYNTAKPGRGQMYCRPTGRFSWAAPRR